MLRIAFIGSGQMARQHLHVVSRRGGAAVVGVHDRAEGPAAEFAAVAGAPAYSSVAALISEARPDVVHVCTPPAAHFDSAWAALEGGAHVYVEKPFALSVRDARALLDLASARGLIACSGHQLLRDPGFAALTARAGELGTIVQVDSHFAFRPLHAHAARLSAPALADHLVDILPHPLYTLVAALERVAGPDDRIELASVQASSTDLHASLRAGDVIGRLSVSLRARPIASSLTLAGTGGSLTCDFVRSVVLGTANTGTAPLEKILNPVAEGAQLMSRTTGSLARRLRTGIAYPGLRELIDEFHVAAGRGMPSPVPPSHLMAVTEIFEELAAEIRRGTPKSKPASVLPRTLRPHPLAVLTGASGFLGSEIASALPRVRGIGRGAKPEHSTVGEWVRADLSTTVPVDAVAGADVVIHAAAETSGGYEAHRRNSVDATANLLRAMHAAGVSRLVLVSSLSALTPPRRSWECQDEQTGRPADPRAFGSYVWGKCMQEEIVEHNAAALGIATRIIRPGALLDPRDPVLPGLMGRRLFGPWHLALGGPGHPIAACWVERCAEAIAWCATHFDEAPAVINLFDPAVSTRRELIALLRTRGWNGRILWLPTAVVTPGLHAAGAILSLARRSSPERLGTWLSYVRPRRYDARQSEAVLTACDAARAFDDTDIALPA
jgi:predicted dehydrogenase/nucleoside-diphosphate-sugar epimerase